MATIVKRQRSDYLIKQGYHKAAHLTAVVLIVAFFTFPIFWLFSTSFKERIEVFRLPPKWIFAPTLSNFEYIFETKPVLKWLLNSVIISLGTAVLSLVLGVPAAYGLSRLKFRGKGALLTSILLIRALPPVVILLPFRVMMHSLGLVGTRTAVILIDTIYNSAFTVWLMSGIFEQLPKGIEEAAYVDGCSRLRTFWSIALPLTKPGLVTAALFALILSWNDFLFAMSLTSPATATLPLGILSTYGMLSVGWTYMTSMCCVAIVPILLISLWLQRYYISGLTFGGVK